MDNTERNSPLVTVSLVGAVLIVLVWALSGGLIYKTFDTPEGRGTFGDLFGAVNALFSGLAFLGVIVAILLQREELELQRAELRVTRQAHEESAKALSGQQESAEFHVRLSAITAVIQGLQDRVDFLDKTERSTSRMDEQVRLRREKFEYADLLKRMVDDLLKRNDTGKVAK